MVANEQKRKTRNAVRRVLGVVFSGVVTLTGGMALYPSHSLAVGAEAKPLLALGARVAGDRARSRIVIDFDRKPDFKLHYLSKPNRIVIDLPSTAFGFNQEDFAPRGLFKDIRYG